MNNKIKFSALLLTAGLAFTSGAQANEVSLEQLVSSMVTYSVSATQQELQNSIQGAVLTASNMFSLEEEYSVATTVTITDLDAKTEEKNKAE